MKATVDVPSMSKYMYHSKPPPIKFYNRYDPYYEFTNFYFSPINLDDHTWPTTEHYFQAQKFVGTPYYDYIRKVSYPRDAFQVSRDPSAHAWIRGDWHHVKNDVMLKALRAKFTQHTDLKKLLLGTEDRELIEHTHNDSYWGDGGDGSGANHLGRLLMQVRNEIKHKETNKSSTTSTPLKSQARLRRSNSLLNIHTTSLSSTSYSNSLPASNSALTHVTSLEKKSTSKPLTPQSRAPLTPQPQRRSYPRSASQILSYDIITGELKKTWV